MMSYISGQSSVAVASFVLSLMMIIMASPSTEEEGQMVVLGADLGEVVFLFGWMCEGCCD